MTMTSTSPAQDFSSFQQQVDQYIAQKKYDQAASLYEQAIEAEPDFKSHYWHLGLLLLLQGQEAEAQTTWMFAMSDGEPEQLEQWIAELMEVLQTEAERRETMADYSIAWILRQHMREVCPDQIDNLLKILPLAIELDLLTDETFEELNITQRLQVAQAGVNVEVLLQVLKYTLDNFLPSPSLLEFVGACIPWIQDLRALREVLLPASIQFAYSRLAPNFAAELVELYLKLDPLNLDALGHLAGFYQNVKDYDRGIETAKRRYELTEYLPEKIFSNHLIIRGLLGAGGYWKEALEIAQRHESLSQLLAKQQPTGLDPVQNSRLLNSGYYLVYFKDQPKQWRTTQNQLINFCQKNIELDAARQGKQYQHSSQKHKTDSLQSLSTRPLKIGYLSHCMATHSVGWLARWLLQHRDRDRFQAYGYFLNYRDIPDPLQDWYVNQFDHGYRFGTGGLGANLAIADQIYQDEIDILIDLDSITLDLTCEVLALKPAPVQVTWLGWDASGLPAIDYFIADPYVLPETAQEYYSEKIWRLPQTYVAVDGFEVGVPTLRRDQLNIPSDAIVFLSAQRGYKRHRDHVKLQMQVIKQVPNSYFLIKGLSDEKAIQTFFQEIADEEGVERSRLRFLPDDSSTQAHRANLAIADVVLDTFPYNGATTTLETLWMGIPLVTRVGEQFAARNSYTMMKNAGITEGIAWSGEEYVEWGVRLGEDAALRQKIHWDLLRSRQTAPLWNAKQFTRDMEDAYEQMWEIYLRK